jgi:membrane associated rhomboid family serine protease
MSYRVGFGGTPPLIRNLIIVNVGIYLTMIFIKPLGFLMFKYLFLYSPGTENFVVSQFFTCMFMHFPDGYNVNFQTGDVQFSFMSRHLLYNMFGLWIFGSMVANVWSAKKVFNFYLACGLGASVAHFLVMYIQHGGATHGGVAGGASGAIYGIMVAAAYLFPNQTVNIYFVIPIKIKYLVTLLIGLGIFLGIRGSGDQVAHWAHLGGAFVAIVYCFGGRLRKMMK